MFNLSIIFGLSLPTYPLLLQKYVEENGYDKVFLFTEGINQRTCKSPKSLMKSCLRRLIYNIPFFGIILQDLFV